MNVCFVSAEVFPFAKTGGLGDVSGALPKYLAPHGVETRMFMPLYNTIDFKGAEVHRVGFLQNVPVQFGASTITFNVLTTKLPGSSINVYLIDCPQLYHRGSVYTDSADEYLRFAFLSYAALVCCQHMGWRPDIVHCNDWHTGLMPLLLRTAFGWDRMFHGVGTVMTVHNIAYQGVFPAQILHSLGLWGFRERFHQEDLAMGIVNFMKTGFLYADAITTVSRTYAREIMTPQFGAGLDGLLRQRRSVVHGIVNGVDYNEWSPERDRYIRARYSIVNPDGKEPNRRNLVEQMRLPYDPRVPTVGIVSRLTGQKGFDLLPRAIARLMDRYELRMTILGSGENRYERYFEELQRRYPRRVSFYRGYSNELSHLIEAGADMFLMPSQFEPCGLNQIYSLRYGTVPIVRKTGGLADTVQHFDTRTGQGTGFVFEHYTSQGVHWALNEALQLWYSNPRAWRRMMLNGMGVNYSWERQVLEYVHTYRSVLRR